MPITMIDAVIVAILAASLIMGYIRGFVRQLVSLAGWIVAYLAAYMFYDDITPWIAELPLFDFDSEAASAEAHATEPSGWETAGEFASMLGIGVYVQRAIAFAAIFFAAKLAVSMVGWLLHGVASLPVLRTVNRYSGAVLALTEAVVIVFIVLLVMEALPLEGSQRLAGESTLFGWMKGIAPAFMDRLQSLWSNPSNA